MTPKEAFEQEMWFVLRKIMKYSLYKTHDKDLDYWVYSPPNLSAEGMPFPVQEIKIIDKLEELGAIEQIYPKDCLETIDFPNNGLLNALNVSIQVIFLKILQPKFGEIYHEYELKSPLEKNIIPDNSGKIQLELFANNYLCPRGGRDRSECYVLRKRDVNKRQAILQMFIRDNTQTFSGKEIMKETGYSTEKIARKALAALFSKIAKKMDCNFDHLIGRNDNGFYLNACSITYKHSNFSS